MQKDVKTMKNMIERGFAYISRNLRLGGVILTLTAALIAVLKPDNIVVLFTPYSGNIMVLSGVLASMGLLSTLMGYAIKR